MPHKDAFFRIVDRYQPDLVCYLAHSDIPVQGWLVLDTIGFGPAFGGIRLLDYTSAEEALKDALRLARAMTWKTRLAGLPCGGAKLTLILRNPDVKSAILPWLGQTIEALRGAYYGGPDMGVTPEDLHLLASYTRYIGCGQGSQISYGTWTARGVMAALRGVRRALDLPSDDWSDWSILVQGLGAVGENVAREVLKTRAHVVVTDLNQEKTLHFSTRHPVDTCDPLHYAQCPADVFVPCARGHVINRAVAMSASWKVVCGSSNNILERERWDDILHQRGCLFIPDVVSSAGAVIAGVRQLLEGASDEQIARDIAAIELRVFRLVLQSQESHVSPLQAVHQLLEEQLPREKCGPL